MKQLQVKSNKDFSDLLALEKLIEDNASKLANDIQSDIVSKWPVASGDSKKGIKKEEATYGYRVYQSLEYGKYVDSFDDIDYVRRPGSKYPPISVIEEWIRRKGIDTNSISPRALAFLIARSIAKKGIKNKKIFLSVYNKYKSKL